MSTPTLPTTMRAWEYSSTVGGIEKNLHINPATPISRPAKPSQHVVKILAVALNPVDYKPAEIAIFHRLLIKKPATPGIDFVGRIVEPAAGSAFKPGQLVFGGAGTTPFAGGALAEYAIAESEGTVAAPSGVDLQSLSTVGVAGLTAYQSILDNAKPGARVFLNGGSGGVGMYGIQIAKASGMHVTTTCSTKNVDFCRSLGADEVIDYKKGPVLQQLQALNKDKKIDLIVDNVGGDTSLYWKGNTYATSKAPYVHVAGDPSLTFIWNMLKAQTWPGFMVGGKPKMVTFFAATKPDQLEQIGKWMQEGKVKAVVDSKFDFEDAIKAIERSKTHRAVGKIVVDVALSKEGLS